MSRPHERTCAARLIIALLLLIGGEAGAHIGSPNIYVDGSAGPYPVRIVVRPPAAIPGRAEITITATGEGIGRVTALPVPSGSSASAMPAPDVAAPVPGRAGLYSAELWIMEQGSYAIHVHVAGAKGEGETLVPLNAVNQGPVAMPAWILGCLAALGALLLGGLVLLAAAAAREAGLPPDGAPTARQRLRGSVAGAVAGLAALLLSGVEWSTWQKMDREYRNNALFKPTPIEAAVQVAGPDRVLTLRCQPDEQGSREWPALVTDHGKLMHAFLLREPELDAFAHIHPAPGAGDAFVAAVPPLPAGRYRVYADITEESGLSQTLTTTVELPAQPPEGAPPPPSGRVVPDPDDSWLAGVAPFQPGGRSSTTAALADGYQMIWENPEEVSRPGERSLRFRVVDAQGKPAGLAPYMGMMGHAAIRREDGAVFAHVHPTGTASMAAQMVLQEKSGGGAMDHGMHQMGGMDHSKHGMAGMDHSMHQVGGAAHDGHKVVFPYEFPQTGPYRIWVQVKVGERVMTGVFDARVTRAGTDQ